MKSHITAKSGGLPSWVTQADSYVQVTNYQATVDQAMAKVFTPDEIVKVQTAVDHYNALSVSEKQPMELQVSPASEKQTGPNTNQVQSHIGCGGITVHTYWWGTEWYLPPCAAALAATGFSVIPVVGTIGAAAIGAAMALSCNQSIYIDMLASGGAYPRPAC